MQPPDPAAQGPSLSAKRFHTASREMRDAVRREQIRGVFAVNRAVFLGTLLFAGLVVAYFFGRLPSAQLLGWGSAVGTIALVRYWLCLRVGREAPSAERLQGWLAVLVALVTVQATAWASLLVLIGASPAPLDIAFVLFVFAALLFAGSWTLGQFLPAYFALAAPVVGGLTVWIALVAWTAEPWLVVAVVLCLAVVMLASARVNRMIRSALLLGQEHAAMIQRLTEENERVQVTLRSIGDGVLATDPRGRITYLNPVAERLTGWRSDEACGRDVEEILHLVDEHTSEPIPDAVRQCLESEDGRVLLEEDLALIDRSGERESAVGITVAPIRDFKRRTTGAVVVVHDLTELRGMARVMSYQANHDALTGLANRREFEARLWAALESARAQGVAHAMAYLDLDQFKLVNDTCGHVAGDELLKQLTSQLLRRMGEGDVLARLGGDEFGVLLYERDMARARETADSLCSAVRDFRFIWDDKVFNIGVSIGLVPVDGTLTPTDLLAAADAACYVAKDQGRNRVHSLDPHDHEVAHRHGEMQWTTRIQRALDMGLFRLRLQRIQPRDSHQPVMAEFLLNMQEGGGELIAPGVFLPAAERFNMMPSIDRAVVRMVFERVYAAQGDPQLAGVSCFTINLSGQSLSDETFLDYVIDELQVTGVNPSCICFEITETAVIAHLARAKQFIQTLRGLGCKFALDDFGSGLSSFGYLRTLPVDFLKIDGLFVRNMSVDPVDYSMVEAINQVGHVMGIRTIAEFVEDSATLRVLQELGVDYTQGFAIHRPELLQ